MADIATNPYPGPEQWNEAIPGGGLMRDARTVAKEGEEEVALQTNFDGTKGNKIDHAGNNCVCNKSTAHSHLGGTYMAEEAEVTEASTGENTGFEEHHKRGRHKKDE